MDSKRFARLTDKQRVCLRMVFMHRSSKEIARELGIGADAVDQRIKTAMRTLGVETRIEAACLLARHEGAEPYQRLVYGPPDVAPEPISAFPDFRSNEGMRAAGEFPAIGVREEQASFEATRWRPSGRFPFPLPIEGGVRNGLSPLQRMVWIAVIAIGTAIGFGAFLSGLQALAQLGRPTL